MEEEFTISNEERALISPTDTGSVDVEMVDEENTEGLNSGWINASDSAAVPPPPIPDEGWERPRRDLKAEAKSPHHLLTHMPMNPYCEACQRAKMQRAPARRQDPPADWVAPKKFADLVNADYIVAQSAESMV